jgi:hypothetical protein
MPALFAQLDSIRFILAKTRRLSCLLYSTPVYSYSIVSLSTDNCFGSLQLLVLYQLTMKFSIAAVLTALVAPAAAEIYFKEDFNDDVSGPSSWILGIHPLSSVAGWISSAAAGSPFSSSSFGHGESNRIGISLHCLCVS